MNRDIAGSLAVALLAAACSNGEPSAPATRLVAAVAGDGQSALVGYPTNVRPAVQVTDNGNHPLAGVSVTFAVTGGGGSITGPAAISTNASGVAQVGGWVVGASAGANTLTATVPGAGSPVTFTATGAQATFHIVIQNVGPALSAAEQTAFDSAVATWQRVVYQGLPPVANFSDTSNECGPGFPAVGPLTINDVYIQVRIDSIDGPGKILGRSGPCFIRNSPDNRTVLGTMIFDSADVANLVAQGQINAVVLHEMAHVLGFGTLWGASYFGCLQLPASAGTFPDTYYSCPKGRAEFDSIGGTGYTGGNKVPLENCQGISGGCGAGTYNSHWRESTFFNELLTGYLNSSTVNPLSVLTIAAIGDLGYTVNYGAAAPYSRTFTTSTPSLVAGSAASVISLEGDVTTGPIRLVDATGRVVRVMVR